MSRLRRSERNYPRSYDSNGRDYLASSVDWSRQHLEDWLASDKVHPHLLLWYNLCIRGRKRFNEGVEWINQGADGYYYDPDNGLQEDLLLECLCDGNDTFLDQSAITYEWPTQRLWARTAWRIVQDNCGPNQAFEHAIAHHPAPAFSLAIDVLCLSFHSVAHRGSNSIWSQILLGPGSALSSNRHAEETSEMNVQAEAKMDVDPGGQNETDTAEAEVETASLPLYKIRRILRGSSTAYLVDWEDDEITGESYQPTWEPKSNVSQLAVDEWNASEGYSAAGADTDADNGSPNIAASSDASEDSDGYLDDDEGSENDWSDLESPKEPKTPERRVLRSRPTTPGAPTKAKRRAAYRTGSPPTVRDRVIDDSSKTRAKTNDNGSRVTLSTSPRAALRANGTGRHLRPQLASRPPTTAMRQRLRTRKVGNYKA